MVWKPAGIVPLVSTRLLEVFIEANLPEGVLNLILGRGSEVGAALAGHADIDAITFTGSNAIGRQMQQWGVASGKKVQLELGGKNAAVVLADADLDHAAENIARGAFFSAGQKCTATSRAIVSSEILPELSERLCALARRYKVGDPLDPETIVGPLSSQEQLDKVLEFVALARFDGGRLLAGGDRSSVSGAGYFINPTVVADLPLTSRVMQEEIFGPVVALVPAASFDDAVALANATTFGLTASIFTRDLSRAMSFARECRAGVVKVNQETAGLELHVPSGGVKQSGSGQREYGKTARDFFTEWKTVYITEAPV